MTCVSKMKQIYSDANVSQVYKWCFKEWQWGQYFKPHLFTTVTVSGILNRSCTKNARSTDITVHCAAIHLLQF